MNLHVDMTNCPCRILRFRKVVKLFLVLVSVEVGLETFTVAIGMAGSALRKLYISVMARFELFLVMFFIKLTFSFV